MKRWHRTWVDLWELWLLPGCVLLLPWAWCFQWFRWLSQHTRVYDEQAQAALQQAQAFGVVHDQAEWLWQRRLVTLLDHADLYLAATRGQRWMHRHLRRQGSWPAAGQAGVLLTFHWGTGMWALRDAAQAGLRPHMLLALGHDAGSWPANAYLRLRAWQVQRCTGAAVVPVDVSAASAHPGTRRRVARGLLQSVLDQREQLLAVVDVPADQIGQFIPVSLNGWPARAPLGLFALCARQGLPLTVYWTDVCLHTGRRHVVVHTLPPNPDAKALALQTFEWLAQLMREQPQKWHFWSLANRYFVRGASKDEPTA